MTEMFHEDLTIVKSKLALTRESQFKSLSSGLLGPFRWVPDYYLKEIEQEME